MAGTRVEQGWKALLNNAISNRDEDKSLIEDSNKIYGMFPTDLHSYFQDQYGNKSDRLTRLVMVLIEADTFTSTNKWIKYSGKEYLRLSNEDINYYCNIKKKESINALLKILENEKLIQSHNVRINGKNARVIDIDYNEIADIIERTEGWTNKRWTKYINKQKQDTNITIEFLEGDAE